MVFFVVGREGEVDGREDLGVFAIVQVWRD